MAIQLSGIAVILFIAFGSLTFILLFIFAKRQIMRFALKSRHTPHVAIGSSAPKSLAREIERRLDVINRMRCEPWLLSETMKSQFEDENLISRISPPHIYRMKVVDDVRQLCSFIKSVSVARSRHSQEDVLQYFVRLHKHNLFRNLDIQILYKFLALYEHARYQPEEFSFDQYYPFSELLQIIKDDIIQSPKKMGKSTNISKAVPCEESEQADESTKPLLIKNLSPISSTSSSRKFTHETAV